MPFFYDTILYRMEVINLNDDIGTRIGILIKTLGIKKVRFAERMNIDQSYVTQLTNGKRNPSDRTIADICREFNVREEWLRNGNGEMFLDFTENEFSKAVATLSNDPFVRSLIIEYCKLDEDSKKLFRNFIHNLSNNMQTQETAIKKTITSVKSETSATEDNFWKNCTVEEAEEKYIKSSSHSAKKKGSPVSNITADTEKKVANQ